MVASYVLCILSNVLGADVKNLGSSSNKKLGKDLLFLETSFS